MDDKKKEEIKRALLVFVKAMIAPTIAFVTSLLTILLSGDPSVAASTALGTVTGSVAQIIANTGGV